jgi:hypothetical protein
MKLLTFMLFILFASCVPARSPYGCPKDVTKVTGDTVPEWMHISMRPKGFVVSQKALSVRVNGMCSQHLQCDGKPFPAHYKVGWCEGKEEIFNQLVKERRVK